MTSLYVFLALLTLFVGGVVWFLHAAWDNIKDQAAEHAKTYGTSYVKCTALIGIAMGATFIETFQNLTNDQAAAMSWWHWTIAFWKPLAAGLAVLVAFLDRSVDRANVKRDAKEAKGESQPPFVARPTTGA